MTSSRFSHEHVVIPRTKRSMVGLIGHDPARGHGRAHGRAIPAALPSAAGTGIDRVLAIGLLAGMDDLLSALYSFPGGYLSDRLERSGLSCSSTASPWRATCASS